MHKSLAYPRDKDFSKCQCSFRHPLLTVLEDPHTIATGADVLQQSRAQKLEVLTLTFYIVASGLEEETGLARSIQSVQCVTQMTLSCSEFNEAFLMPPSGGTDHY